jgi:hypothetical protein
MESFLIIILILVFCAKVIDLTRNEVKVRPKRVIGVGNVGWKVGQASYVLYRPESDQRQFKTAKYATARGFG